MTTFGMISLTTPAMLAGLALLSLPIAAHLLNRRAKRRVEFPSIVLLERAHANQSQLFRLRRLLLLLLRCAVIAMIVLAFAQPLWLESEPVAAAGDGPGATVVVIDASASAGQRVGGVLAIESMRAAAARALDEAFARGDVMNVVVASGRAATLFPRMTHNVDAARSAVAGVEPSAERADLYAALARAGELLAGHGGDRRLVVVSDLQASNWADVQPRAVAAPPLPPRTRARVVAPSGTAEGNGAVVGLRVSPARPMAGREADAIATLANFGDRAAVVRVELLAGDVPVAEAEALVEPRQQEEVAMRFRVGAAGDQRLRARIRDDALPVDNERHLVVRAIERRAVVVVADDDADDAGTGAYFLTRAVAPHDDERNRADARLVRSVDVTDDSIADAAAVFVGYTGAWPDAAARALRGYVEAGGGLVVFSGSGPVDRNLAALDALDPRGLLPWQTTGLRDLGKGREALAISDGEWRSALLRAFDGRSREAMSQARFWRVWGAGPVHPEASVLLRFDDGSPAMAERPVGRGRVVLAAFSPDPTAGDLVKHGSFVALIHGLIEGLEPGGAGSTGPLVGEPIRLAVAKSRVGGTGLHVVGPGEHPVGTVDIRATRDEVVAVVPRGERPGFYDLRLRDTTLATGAAHLDPRESDLSRMDPAAVGAMLTTEGGSVAVSETAAADGGDGREEGRPLWGWALLAALGLIAVELGLLGYWRR